MGTEPQLFRIDPSTHESEAVTEVEFAKLGFQERRDIQEWVANNPGILGEDLLILRKEFSGFDWTNERLDLLAVDRDGKLVVIELKRDDTGTDVHWQAIKYASYLRRVDADSIVEMLAEYRKLPESDARLMLVRHVNSDDLVKDLNKDQRIILASHRFAREVTSAAVWLNEKVPDKNLITCVQLIPYSDAKTESLYVQANTIIPVPGIEDYVVGVGDSLTGDGSAARGTSTLSETFARNRNDEVTRFLRRVADLAVSEVSDRLKPDKKSRWAGDAGYRYYHLWYSTPLWANWEMTYLINLYPGDEDSPNTWRADVGFAYWGRDVEDLVGRLEGLAVYDDQRVENREIVVARQGALDDSFSSVLAETLSHFIEVVTPVVHEFERNEEDA